MAADDSGGSQNYNHAKYGGSQIYILVHIPGHKIWRITFAQFLGSSLPEKRLCPLSTVVACKTFLHVTDFAVYAKCVSLACFMYWFFFATFAMVFTVN